MRINPKYIQLFAEALIPLMGFFLWDWSLYFILLFYFIDMIMNEVLVNVKAKKISQYQSTKNAATMRWSLLSLTLFICSILLIHLAMFFIAPGIHFLDETTAFWNYEELGIKQGYLLVPLQVFVSYQQYKMEFLVPARYRTIESNLLWKTHIRAHFVLIGFAGLCLGICQFILLPEIVYVLGIVIFTIAYRLLFTK